MRIKSGLTNVKQNSSCQIWDGGDDFCKNSKRYLVYKAIMLTPCSTLDHSDIFYSVFNIASELPVCTPGFCLMLVNPLLILT